MNVIDEQNNKQRKKAEQILENVLINIEKDKMKKQIEDDEKLGLLILKEDRREDINEKHKISINSINKPMINERNIGNLKKTLHPLPLENAKNNNKVTYLSGNNTKTNINTTSTKRTSKMTNDKKTLIKKTNGQKQYLDQTQNQNLPYNDQNDSSPVA